MNQISYSQEEYRQQLLAKVVDIRKDFQDFFLPEIQVFQSPEKHFRMRAEFKMWHEGENIHYAMFNPENRHRYFVKEFPIGSTLINQLMPELSKALHTNEVLRKKLFQVEFLTTLSGEALISLIYHTALGSEWESEARQLGEELDVDIIGRSRGQKIVLKRDYVIEQLCVGEKTFRYQQVESSFTQPNARVCEKMLTWAVEKSQGFGGDLIELYCGNGNFTLPLAQNFGQVLATEVAKTSVKSALFNIELNGVKNVNILRMSSEEFSQALDKIRDFNRLKDLNLDQYAFSTIFVDPPRAGMDPHTTDITQRFDNIIYISCNPMTLHENLKTITQTHDITDFALFDQFPYTHHVECGVILKKRSSV